LIQNTDQGKLYDRYGFTRQQKDFPSYVGINTNKYTAGKQRLKTRKSNVDKFLGDIQQKRFVRFRRPGLKHTSSKKSVSQRKEKPKETIKLNSPPRKTKKMCRVCNAIVDRSYSSYFKESAPKHFLKYFTKDKESIRVCRKCYNPYMAKKSTNHEDGDETSSIESNEVKSGNESTTDTEDDISIANIAQREAMKKQQQNASGSDTSKRKRFNPISNFNQNKKTIVTNKNVQQTKPSSSFKVQNKVSSTPQLQSKSSSSPKSQSKASNSTRIEKNNNNTSKTTQVKASPPLSDTVKFKFVDHTNSDIAVSENSKTKYVILQTSSSSNDPKTLEQVANILSSNNVSNIGSKDITINGQKYRLDTEFKLNDLVKENENAVVHSGVPNRKFLEQLPSILKRTMGSSAVVGGPAGNYKITNLVLQTPQRNNTQPIFSVKDKTTKTNIRKPGENSTNTLIKSLSKPFNMVSRSNTAFTVASSTRGPSSLIATNVVSRSWPSQSSLSIKMKEQLQNDTKVSTSTFISKVGALNSQPIPASDICFTSSHMKGRNRPSDTIITSTTSTLPRGAPSSSTLKRKGELTESYQIIDNKFIRI